MPTPTTAAPHTNRLANEASPYLLQHAHNPVDWYAWGPEAFEAARRLDRPIFLSVGYSTCYWCHVMERQCFENERVAEEMNRRFINIKVDREERPDVDQLYMTAVQLLTQQGGWPMSVFLLPDLRPFYGGTYFPPTDQGGRPGFVTLLRALDDAYRNRRGDVEKTAAQVSDVLRQLAEPRAAEGAILIDDGFVESLIERSTVDYDPTLGGFGAAPKFPRETLLELLLVHNRYYPNPARQRMVLHTLVAMAAGGIRDQLGGAFHRYSTDAQWLVPHFEIMLYDNAMLAWVYTEAYRQTRQNQYAEVARGVLDFILREMTSPDGAFYTAFDAEVDAREGEPYLWTAEQIEEALGLADARLFGAAYGVDRGPNFADPHHGTGQPDKNILYLPRPLADVAAEQGLEREELDRRLARMRAKLHEVRRGRKQPMLDTKVITSWNALAIRALGFAGRVLGEARYTEAAGRAADYLLRKHRMADGVLYRMSREGVARHEGFLDDYAYMTQALLELASGGASYRRQQAQALATETLKRFGDAAGGLFFTPAGAHDLIARQKVGTDSPLPSGNAVAAMVLLELGQAQAARDILAAFAGTLEHMAEGASAIVQAATCNLQSHEPIAVADEGEERRPQSPQDRAADVVRLSAQWASDTELRVEARITEGYHINAHDAGEGLIATRLRVTGEAAEIVAEIKYPAGEVMAQATSVYSGAVNIVVRFKRPARGKALALALTYQACTDTACLPPATARWQAKGT